MKTKQSTTEHVLINVLTLISIAKLHIFSNVLKPVYMSTFMLGTHSACKRTILLKPNNCNFYFFYDISQV